MTLVLQIPAIISNRQSLRLTNPPIKGPKSLRNDRAMSVLSMTAIDRRGFLAAAAGALVTGADRALASSASKMDDKTLSVLMTGLEKINGELSNGQTIPLDGEKIAVFTDGSPFCSAACEAVGKLGAATCEISLSSDNKEARTVYKDAECTAAIFSSEAKIKDYMSGAGLECRR